MAIVRKVVAYYCIESFDTGYGAFLEGNVYDREDVTNPDGCTIFLNCDKVRFQCYTKQEFLDRVSDKMLPIEKDVEEEKFETIRIKLSLSDETLDALRYSNIPQNPKNTIQKSTTPSNPRNVFKCWTFRT